MIYLDNAATTQISDEVLDKMLPYLKSEFGNASSVHTFGRHGRIAIERSRNIYAKLLNCNEKNVIFTSSASESNNLAIKGLLEGLMEKFPSAEPEVVASVVEHPCVIETLKHLQKLGRISIKWLPVDNEGLINIETLNSLINDNTVLVSIMFVNNEIGTVMPIPEIGKLLKEKRKNSSLPLYFHCDAVQAALQYNLDVNLLGVDLLTLSAHKIYGPKGTGILFVRDGIELVRQIDGGGQEYYKRGGTENVAGIVGAGAAVDKITAGNSKFQNLKILQDNIIKSVSEQIEAAHLTGHREKRAFHITSFVFENVDPEALVIALDREGFAVSSGSACSSGVVKQSHVIEALNLNIAKKSAALRISTGWHTTVQEIDRFIFSLKNVIAHLRSSGI